jgi:nucleoid-associated protein YgaU
LSRLIHKTPLLFFSAPVAVAAGLVAHFAFAAAPAPQVGAVASWPVPNGVIPEPVTLKRDRSQLNPQRDSTFIPSGEGASQGRMRAFPQAQWYGIELGERPSSALRAPSPDGGRVSVIAPVKVDRTLKSADEIVPAPLLQNETLQITIKPGSSLWALSRELYGAGRHYVILFQANKGQIQDPRLIYPGQVLAAPKQMDN